MLLRQNFKATPRGEQTQVFFFTINIIYSLNVLIDRTNIYQDVLQKIYNCETQLPKNHNNNPG